MARSDSLCSRRCLPHDPREAGLFLDDKSGIRDANRILETAGRKSLPPGEVARSRPPARQTTDQPPSPFGRCGHRRHNGGGCGALFSGERDRDFIGPAASFAAKDHDQSDLGEMGEGKGDESAVVASSERTPSRTDERSRDQLPNTPRRRPGSRRLRRPRGWLVVRTGNYHLATGWRFHNLLRCASSSLGLCGKRRMT